MKKYEYIFFDVAGTLLYKPSMFKALLRILKSNGYLISEAELISKHKLVSELIKFPDRTNEEFYEYFNSELLYSLGIIPTKQLLEAIFNSCSYLKWEKYDDTSVLNKIEIPMGIISNFNTTLKGKLNSFFGPIFQDVLVSEELGIAKPEIMFYEKAIERIGVLPEKILYIGDSLKLDIEPALSVGIQSLLIDRENIYPVSKNRIQTLKDVLTLINE